VLAWGVITLAVVGAVLWSAGVRPPRERPAAHHHAEPRARLHCDATWVGGARGDWSRAANWSTGAVPDRSTHACIPRGTTVVVSHGRNQVWAVESGGSLRLTGGALLMMGTVVASETADLSLVHATLGGPGKLIVTRHMFFGPAGKMHGAGSVTLGPASHSEINAGVGKRSAFIGADDGTGPAVVNSDNAPGPLCNRYSPPWAEDCATRRTREERDVRRAWSDFAAAANRGSRAALVARLAPRTCRLATEQRRGDCDHVAAGVLEEVAQSGPLTPALGRVLVEGDEAVGAPRHPHSVRFARVGGAWRVSVL
jgi:hypothetical protein